MGVPVPGPLNGTPHSQLPPVHIPSSGNSFNASLPSGIDGISAAPSTMQQNTEPQFTPSSHPMQPMQPLIPAAPISMSRADSLAAESSFLSLSSQQTDRGYGPPHADDLARMGSYSGSEVVGGPQVLGFHPPGQAHRLQRSSQGSENVAMYQNVAADPGWGGSMSHPGAAHESGRRSFRGRAGDQSGATRGLQGQRGAPKRHASGRPCTFCLSICTACCSGSWVMISGLGS